MTFNGTFQEAGVYAAFDIGNVICHFDINKFTDKLSEITGINNHDAYFFLEQLQKMQDMGLTCVAHSLENKFRLSPTDLQELLDAWNSTIEPNEMMLNFLANIRSEGVKTALLSNMGSEHISYLRTKYPEIFAGAIQHISCEVGARKPTKLFFQSFCLDHDEFSGSLYVDDIEENLRTSKKYGFKVYHFSLETLAKESKVQQKQAIDRMKSMLFDKQ